MESNNKPRIALAGDALEAWRLYLAENPADDPEDDRRSWHDLAPAVRARYRTRVQVANELRRGE